MKISSSRRFSAKAWPRFFCLVFLSLGTLATAQPLIVHVNRMSERGNLDAVFYYADNKTAINDAFLACADPKTCNRYLFEMAMRSKDLSELVEFSPETRAEHSSRAEEFLKEYVDWFDNLNDTQLEVIAQPGIEPLEVRAGRIQSVVEFLCQLYVARQNWAEIDHMLSGISSVLYFNDNVFSHWKKALLLLNTGLGEQSAPFKPYWTTLLEWSEKFPLRTSLRNRYCNRAKAALDAINPPA